MNAQTGAFPEWAIRLFLGAPLGLVGLDAATLVLLQARNIIGSSPPPG